jgi:hypothetical protein
MKFEIGKKYSSEFPVEITARTEKYVTFKTITPVTRRAKVKTHPSGVEYFLFKCWLVEASDIYDKDAAHRLAMERAYYS